MKQMFYIFACGFLGLIVSTLMHAGIEMVAIQIIFGHPEMYFNTVWWQKWEVIHAYGSGALWVMGFVTGLYLGHKWWVPYGSKPGFYHWSKQK